MQFELTNTADRLSVRGALGIPLGEYAQMGDSLINGGYAGSSLASRVAHLSGGRFRQRLNLAASGRTSQQVLDEQVPAVIASGVKFVILNTGVTNDKAQGVPEATSRSNTIAIWNALRGAGIFFVDVGMLPNANAGTALQHVDHELWRRQYCSRNGIPHVDAFSPLATPAGAYVSGYGFDNLHPNAVAADIVAQKTIEVIDKPWSVAPLMELIDRAAGATVPFANAVGFGGAGAALPSGWFPNGTGPTYSVQAPDSGQQNAWLRATFAGANALAGFNGTAKTLANLGWSAGDRIAFGCLLRWSTSQSDGIKPRLQLNNSGATVVLAPPFDEWGGTTGSSIYAYGEYTIANAAVNMNFLATPTVAGYFEISRPILYNLTANGLT